MIERTIDGVIVRHGDSLAETADWLARTPLAPWSANGPSWNRASTQLNQYKTRDFDHALQLAKFGWHEGADRVHYGLAALLAYTGGGVSPWRYDMAGDVPDVPRYLAGVPDCMKRRTRQNGNKPIVHIMLNTALSGSADYEQIMNYGIAIAGLVDYLENHGRRVELDRVGIVSDGGSLGGVWSMQGWKVKRAEEPLDLAATAFATAHPSSHRRLVWGMRERCPVGGYGSPQKLKPKHAAMIDAEGAFILDSLGHDYARATTLLGALQLAAERLNAAAGETLVEIEA